MTTERDIKNYISYAERKGREEGLLEAAKKMLAEGLSVEIVAKCTGLSEEQIEDLKVIK